jgi:hypothetical protein
MGVNKQRELHMKMFLATAALVTLIASPVLAQSVDKQTNVRARAQTTQTAPQFGRMETGQRHSTSPAYDVYDGAGHYVGSDPDPRIRQNLLNDNSSSD